MTACGQEGKMGKSHFPSIVQQTKKHYQYLYAFKCGHSAPSHHVHVTGYEFLESPSH